MTSGPSGAAASGQTPLAPPLSDRDDMCRSDPRLGRSTGRRREFISRKPGRHGSPAGRRRRGKGRSSVATSPRNRLVPRLPFRMSTPVVASVRLRSSRYRPAASPLRSFSVARDSRGAAGALSAHGSRPAARASRSASPALPRNTTGQSTLRCPAQREITSAARRAGQRARRRRKSEYPPQARPARAMAQVEGSGTVAT